VAITSYQGGHVEFFKYLIDLLRRSGGENIKVFGGGGGVIVPAEIRELMAYGVTRLYSPEDGAKLGLQGMIDDVIRSSDYDLCALAPAESEAMEALRSGDRRQLARVITAVENRSYPARMRQALLQAAAGIRTPILGITGTGGAGNPLSPMSSFCAFAWTRGIACARRSSRSIPRASAPAARCSATAFA